MGDRVGKAGGGIADRLMSRPGQARIGVVETDPTSGANLKGSSPWQKAVPPIDSR